MLNLYGGRVANPIMNTYVLTSNPKKAMSFPTRQAASESKNLAYRSVRVVSDYPNGKHMIVVPRNGFDYFVKAIEVVL